MIAPAATLRLLDGPPQAAGAETLAAHLARVGPLPQHPGGSLIDVIDEAGLRGRGGAGYPSARKWAAARQRSRGDAVVVANGAETEPMSAKDRVLMTTRPHLVLDGVLLAAEAVAAQRAVVYITRAHDDAAAAVSQAIDERRAAGDLPLPVSLSRAPHRYVAGEESAVIAHLNGGAARPTVVPPRPFERGVDGRPTLVHNVETLAHAAVIARHGADRYRRAGADGATGTVLVTMAGAIRAFGGDPARLGDDRWRDGKLLGYCEVHIEQGPVLEARSMPVAVVSAIAGQEPTSSHCTGISTTPTCAFPLCWLAGSITAKSMLILGSLG